MPLKAIFLGSLGSVTCGIQQRALNAAFNEEGTHWNWTPELCREFAGRVSCSADGIAAYARQRGVRIDVMRVHRRKTEIFRELLNQVRVPPRSGLKKLIDAARSAQLDLALVVSAPPEDVDSMLAAAGLCRQTFTFVGDATDATRPKPAPDIYLEALAALSLDAAEAIAVEDTVEGTEISGGGRGAVRGVSRRSAVCARVRRDLCQDSRNHGSRLH